MRSTTPTRIIVVGGGFAGLSTALELERAFARDDGVEITLISRENFPLFTPMHQPDAPARNVHTMAVPIVRHRAVASPACGPRCLEDSTPSPSLVSSHGRRGIAP